jgi:hypothetical protein
MMDGSAIVQPTGVDFRSELILLGASSVQTSFSPVVFRNLSGPGGLAVSGPQTLVSALVDVATYTGTTTIVSGTVRVGGVSFQGPKFIQVPGLTAGQGDYIVKRFAEVGGVGVIGLAPGKKIFLDGGTLDPGPGALPYDPGALTINGDLVFGANSFYRCEAVGSTFDRVTVNGTVDLSAARDVIAVAPDVLNGTVVMSYLSRIGEFDEVYVPTGAQLVYTSPPNSGPGQVMVLIPEVNGLAIACIIGAATITRRRTRQT